MVFLGVKANGNPTVIAGPVADRMVGETRKILLALYVEVHSRLVSWWLTNAWRSEQASRAVWEFGDREQIVPAAACARSLLETAAAFWADSRKLRARRRIRRVARARAADRGARLREGAESGEKQPRLHRKSRDRGGD